MFRNFFQPKPPAAAGTPAADELYAEATRAYQSKDFARAIPLFERVIALKPDHAEAYYKRGNALKDLGQLEPALAVMIRLSGTTRISSSPGAIVGSYSRPSA